MLNKQFDKITCLFPDRIALVYKQQQITYRDLQKKIQQFAAGLRALGVMAEKTVALLCPNCPQYIISFYAVARLGAKLIPINPAFQAGEISRYLQKTGTEFIITDKVHLELCEKIIESWDSGPCFIVLNNPGKRHLDFEHVFKEDLLDDQTRQPHQGDFIYLFSSGSTGRPKLLNRSQKNYLNELEGFITLTGMREQDCNLCTIPLFHSHGIGSCLLPTLGCGATLVVLDQFSPPQPGKDVPFFKKINLVFDLIKAYGVTIFPAIPYIFRALVDHPASSKAALKGVRLCFSSGNFLPEDVYNDFLNHFGISIRQIYGCSEAGGVCLNNATGTTFNSRGVGTPFKGVNLRIVDDDDEQDVLCGVVGEIYIKSESMTSGYTDLPELNKSAFIEGYFRTGDLGMVDENGNYIITGRKKLLIDTGGNKVDPFEVEDFLMTHPQISEAVVVGVKGLAGNELIKAALVLSGACSKEQIFQFCRGQLADYKIPKIIDIRSSIPKNAVGKILRRVLIEEDDESEDLVEELIVKLLSHGLKVKENAEVDIFESFESFGIDSTMILELNAALEKYFGKLPPTLFFENQNIHQLVKFLRDNYGNKIETFMDKADCIPEKKARYISHNRPDDIAVIGLWGRYPEAPELEILWENLTSGRDCIREIPRNRWDWEEYYNEDRLIPGTSYSKWGGFLEDIDKFDAALFRITPREACLIDPQERVFLETAWATLEDAGYSRKFFYKQQLPVGVFVGVMWGHYQLHSIPGLMKKKLKNSAKSYYWSIANRVSYFFNLKGPSMAVDTACSSSLTSIHLACESIKRGECTMALAGGVNLILHPLRYILIAEGLYASTDGRCRSFGEGGDGYVPGEGSGAVLLKSLNEAEKAGDHIYGIIRGSWINHCGKTNGFTVPSPVAQGSLVRRALESANLEHGSLSYIEAHGTGTELGDPIEIRGLSSVFTQGNCTIGSIKSNIGHLEAAAGIAGVTKVLLQLKHRQLVPSLHSRALNSKIDFQASPFTVQQTLESWTGQQVKEGEIPQELPLRAGVSSFGAGGSNAHLILEEYRMPVVNKTESGPFLILLSARSFQQISEYGKKLATFLKRETCSLANLAYTLQIGREELEKRVAFVISNKEALLKQLHALNENVSPEIFHGTVTGTTRSGKERKQEIRYVEQLIDTGKLAELASAWVKGKPVPWEKLHEGKNLKRISLPVYPFDKQSFWLPEENDISSAEGEKLHPLLDAMVSDFEYQKFRTHFSGDESFFEHHLIDNRKILPGVIFLEMARAAAEFSWKSEVAALGDVVWSRPFLADESDLLLETRLIPNNEYVEFQIISPAGELYTSGKIFYKHWGSPQIDDTSAISRSFTSELPRFKTQSKDNILGPQFYKQLAQKGYKYGATLQMIRQLWRSKHCALALLKDPAGTDRDLYGLHPAVLDAALQAVKGITALDDESELLLPFSIGRLKIITLQAKIKYVRAELKTEQNSATGLNKIDLFLLSEQEEIVCYIKDFVLRSFLKQQKPDAGLNIEITEILSRFQDQKMDLALSNNLLNQLFTERL